MGVSAVVVTAVLGKDVPLRQLAKAPSLDALPVCEKLTSGLE